MSAIMISSFVDARSKLQFAHYRKSARLELGITLEARPPALYANSAARRTSLRAFALVHCQMFTQRRSNNERANRHALPLHRRCRSRRVRATSETNCNSKASMTQRLIFKIHNTRSHKYHCLFLYVFNKRKLTTEKISMGDVF